MEVSKTNNRELLYIGDSTYDMECAKNANIDFALASWGSNLTEDISVTFRLSGPLNLLDIII